MQAHMRKRAHRWGLFSLYLSLCERGYELTSIYEEIAHGRHNTRAVLSRRKEPGYDLSDDARNLHRECVVCCVEWCCQILKGVYEDE